MMMASRELRRVPRGWQHPRDERGHYIGLFPFTTEAEERAQYARYGWNFDENHEGGWDQARYMPEPGDDAQIMAYETVSEGTPITGRAFDDTPDGRLKLLRDLLADGRGIAGAEPGIEGWAAIMFGERAPLLNLETGAFEA